MLNLKDFELIVEHGPLDSITPQSFVEAFARVDELQQIHAERRAAYNAKWKPQETPKKEQPRNTIGQF